MIDDEKIYTYILVYVDGFLIIFKNPKIQMDDIAFQFRLKEDSIGQLDELLSIDISKRHIGGKGEYWVMGSEKYIKEALRKI